MVLWTVDSQDYRRPGVRQIVDRAISGAMPGAIMLLHDGGGDRSQTVAAIPRIVKRLRAKHYHLVTLPRLLAERSQRVIEDERLSGVIRDVHEANYCAYG
jgi:peptidoglycan/xylan/chitin deacetylase (PgdA/CDA1 family)